MSCYRVRVRAYDGADFGPWVESESLGVDHQEPPTAPTILTPTAGQVFSDTVPISWTESTDPEDDPLSYRGEYTLNGTDWIELFGYQDATAYDWDTREQTEEDEFGEVVVLQEEVPESDTVQVRVYAFDGILESGPGTSAVFEISRDDTQGPNTPSLTVTRISDSQVRLTGSAFSHDVAGRTHQASQFQVQLAANGESWDPLVAGDEEFQTQSLTQIDVFDLANDVLYAARVRYRDNLGNASEWSSTVTFTTNLLWTDFSEETVTLAPAADWSSVPASVRVRANQRSHGAQSLYHNGSTNFVGAFWDRPGLVGNGTAIVRFRVPHTSFFGIGVLMRWNPNTVGAGVPKGYGIMVQGNTSLPGQDAFSSSIHGKMWLGDSLGLNYIGVPNAADEVGAGIAALQRETDYWLRVEWEGEEATLTHFNPNPPPALITETGEFPRFRARVWADGTAEPTTWQFNHLHDGYTFFREDLPTIGRIGLLFRGDQGAGVVDYFAVGPGTQPFPPTTATNPRIIYPLMGQTHDASVDIEWVSSFRWEDPETATWTYDLEWSNDGETWAEITSDLAATSFTWNVAALPSARSYQIRVRSTDQNGLVSEWATSQKFIVDHLPYTSTFHEFTDDDIGTPPDGFSETWQPGGLTTQPVRDPLGPSRHESDAKVSRRTDNRRHALKQIIYPDDFGQHMDGGGLLRFRMTGEFEEAGIGLRVRGSEWGGDDPISGYFVSFVKGVRNAGNFNVLLPVNVAWWFELHRRGGVNEMELIPYEYYLMRAEVEGLEIRGKIWLEDQPEPAAWTFRFTDPYGYAPHQRPGNFGFGIEGESGLWWGRRDMEVDFFGTYQLTDEDQPPEPPEVDEPPSGPGLTAVVESCVIFLLSWTESINPEGNPLTYEGEYRFISVGDSSLAVGQQPIGMVPVGGTGGSATEPWVPLFSDLDATEFSWNVTGLPAGFYQVRVRAFDAVTGLFSDWTTLTVQLRGTWPEELDPTRHLFFGASSDNDIYKLDLAALDGPNEFHAILTYNHTAYGGPGGEVVFNQYYVVLEWAMAVTVRCTPIIDFVHQHDEAVDLVLPAQLERTKTQEFEIALSKPITDGSGAEWGRGGMRGTWFSVELKTVGQLGCAPLIFHGCEVDHDVVREAQKAENATS